MSERCERMDERVAQYLRLDSCLFQTTVHRSITVRPRPERWPTLENERIAVEKPMEYRTVTIRYRDDNRSNKPTEKPTDRATKRYTNSSTDRPTDRPTDGSMRRMRVFYSRAYQIFVTVRKNT